jgi:hypothetical protein
VLAPPSHAELKARHRAERDSWASRDLSIRIHRALSWLGRADSETDDEDVRFLLLWVAFNAAYAGPITNESVSEREAFRRYFGLLLICDRRRRIADAIHQRFSNEIRVLLANPYVYAPFWQHQAGEGGHEEWQLWLERDNRAAQTALLSGETDKVLSIIFGRLYVLRNQLVHGGATWNSAINRNQVRDGVRILSWLLPIFLDLMMDAPDAAWGGLHYPVVD